ncbi:hypothetical protein KCP75_18480 [Salmonella enterica subsp. enterica]|nr:hypothetical protein KCP75_18480 [Salmonella enterica subsp. enterica]
MPQFCRLICSFGEDTAVKRWLPVLMLHTFDVSGIITHVPNSTIGPMVLKLLRQYGITAPY